MKKFLLPAVALFVSILALSLLAPSGAYAQSSHTPSHGAHSTTPKVETYMVIKVTDENKDESKGEKKVEYKAIAASHFKDEQKRVSDDYKQKMKEWHDLRKTDSSAPMPKRIKIQKLQSDYETQKVAQEYADKLKKEAEDKDKDNGDAKSTDVKK